MPVSIVLHMLLLKCDCQSLVHVSVDSSHSLHYLADSSNSLHYLPYGAIKINA